MAIEHLEAILRGHARRAKERNSIRDEPSRITPELLVQMHIAEALDALLLTAVHSGIDAGVFKDG